MAKRKVLIVFLSCGNGHRRAAQAIEDIFSEGFETRRIDALEYAPSLVRWIFQEGYRIAVSFLPFVWKAVFLFFRANWIKKFYNIAGRLIDKVVFSSFIEEIRIFSPDIVISTHFTSSSLAVRLKEEQAFKLITCITDFWVYPLWVEPDTDYYCAGSEFTRKMLVSKYNVPPEKIWLTGIPLRKSFFGSPSPDKYRPPQGVFSMLVFTSYFAYGPIWEIVKTFHKKCAIYVIYGGNFPLRIKMQRLQEKARFLQFYPRVEDMWNLMNAVDLVVTKPGGLTVSECILKEKPMVFMSAIYGQETENAHFIVRNGLGFFPKKSYLIDTIKHIIESPEILQTIRKNFQRFKQENSFQNIRGRIESLGLDKDNGS